jgi:hypothetical protein
VLSILISYMYKGFGINCMEIFIILKFNFQMHGSSEIACYFYQILKLAQVTITDVYFLYSSKNSLFFISAYQYAVLQNSSLR